MKQNTLKIMSIAGARPNFMKLASIADAVIAYNEQHTGSRIEHCIVHTGQHYDKRMSAGFFQDLGIPEPDVNLEVGSGSHAVQTAEIMKRFEQVLLEHQPDILLVVGDVNSTIACTLVAAKIEYSDSERRRPLLVHVEAGLRSRDRDMPEEINRVLTDAISDVHFVTEQSGLENLSAEGVDPAKVHLVGNVMIDTLITHLERARQSTIKNRLGLDGEYALVTLHRPSNVDDKQTLERLLESIVAMSSQIQVVFPVHPRTRQRFEEFGFWHDLQNDERLLLTEPLGYLDFLHLISTAKLVVTDSGGIQEETTYLGVPCVTLRHNTERPVTVTVGSNYLIGPDPEKIRETVTGILNGEGKNARIPELWDGRAGERIVEILTAAIRVTG